MLWSIEIVQYIPDSTCDSSKQDQHGETEILYIANCRKCRFQFVLFKAILGQLSNEGIKIAIIDIGTLQRFLYHIGTSVGILLTLVQR